MGKVFIHVMMSLDGFISKPDEMDMDWMMKYDAEDPIAKRLMNEIGAVVIGNRGFREGTMTADMLPYGGMKVPQFVVSHLHHEPVTLGPLTFTFVTDGIEQAIKLAKEAAGDKRVALLGASIPQQCLNAGLVDEIVIHLVPVLLGDGLSLFGHLGSEHQLQREEVVTAGQITSFRFSVVRR